SALRFSERRSSVTVTIASLGSSNSYPTICEISSRRISATRSGRRIRPVGRCRRQEQGRNFQLPPAAAVCLLKFSGGNFLNQVSLDLIAHLNIVEVLEADTALKSLAHFGYVILKAPQRRDIAFPRYNAIANQARSGVTAYVAVNDHGTCD